MSHCHRRNCSSIKLRKIEIFIDEIRDYITGRSGGLDEIVALRGKVNAFVRILERYDRLPRVDVCFAKAWQEHEYWSGDIGGCDYGCRSEFDDLMMDEDMPIIEYILSPLERLRNCDAAFIIANWFPHDDAGCYETDSGEFKTTDEQYERVDAYIDWLEDQMEMPR